MKAFFKETKEIPHIPKIVQELIASFNDENTDIDTLSSKVSQDTALTAKVLRLANSAYYGLSREVVTANDAVLLLGFSTLRTMVMASGLSSTFKAQDGFDPKTFWEESFAIAELAKWVASYNKSIDADIGFTCGMLHNIGSVMIRLNKPKEAKDIDEKLALGGLRHEIEYAQLGFDYTDIGAELAKRWKFPQLIQDAIKQQNNPSDSLYASVINIAKYLYEARQQGLGHAHIIEHFPNEIAVTIGLDTEALCSNLNDIREIQNHLFEQLNVA